MIDSVTVRLRADGVGRELLVSHDTGWDPAALLCSPGVAYDSISLHKHAFVYTCMH